MFEAEPAHDFEAVIVENGSTDNAIDKLLAIHAADPRFKSGGLTAGLTSRFRCPRIASLRDPVAAHVVPAVANPRRSLALARTVRHARWHSAPQYRSERPRGSIAR